MKRLLLIAALLAWLGGAVSAQQKQPRHVLDEMTHSMFDALDSREFKTGILLQRSVLMVNPFRYDGQAIADSASMDAASFGKLYGQFRSGSVRKGILPEPEIYLSDLRRYRERPDTIPLALMAMQFDYIRADAFERGLLRWDTLSKKVAPAARRSQSPYAQDTCFAFAAMLPRSSGKHVVFRLPSRFIFNNLGWDIQQIQIDFGDGAGWRNVQANECVAIDYLQAGSYRISLRLQQNDALWTAHTGIEVPASKSTFGFEADYSMMPDDVVDLSGVSLKLFYDCEDHKLRKPFIVVEGFGGDRVDYRKMLALLDKGGITFTGKLQDWLDAEGYDLIWIDWANSNASIADNAAALQGALMWINDRKHADGSAEPNTLVGASMGGLVGKYCLLSMENIQKIDSEVERFFTYDSPLKGATYPLGIQCLVLDLVDLADFSGSNPQLDAALQLLNGDAATDMLRWKAEMDANGNISITSIGFDALQAQMDAMEAIRPLTGITRHIAISNGAGNGTFQESVISDLAIYYSITVSRVSWDPTPSWLYDVNFEAQAYTTRNGNTLLYEREIVIDPAFGPNEVFNALTVSTPTPLNIDEAPGGVSDIGLDVLEEALEEGADNVPHYLRHYLDFNLTHFCFTPTVSAFGAPATVPLGTPNPAAGSAASRSSASLDNSVELPWSGNGEFNQEHVSMNSRIADLIVSELTAQTVSDVLGSTLSGSQIYNFGRAAVTAGGGFLSTPHHISQNLSIENGAQLWINRDSRIGFTNNTANPHNLDHQEFGVSVPGAACEEVLNVTVEVKTGGKIIVGDYDNGLQNTGQFVFGEGSNLLINTSEGLKIDKRSKLVVADGAVMRIKSGATVKALDLSSIEIRNGGILIIESGGLLELNWGAQCAVSDGGKLMVEPGAILQISNSGTYTHILSGGEIIIRPGAIVRLWDGPQDDGNAYLKISEGGKMRVEGEYDVNGNGYIWLQGNPVGVGQPIYEDLRSEIKYHGIGKTARFFFLDNSSLTAVNKPFRLENMEIVCNGPLGGLGSQNAVTRIYDITLTGDKQGTALSVEGGTFLHIKNTDVIGFSIGAEITGHTGIAGGLPKIELSKFIDCWEGIAMYNSRYLYINNTDFIGCTGTALWLEDVSRLVNLSQSTVTGLGGFADVGTGAEIQDLLNAANSDGIRLQNVPRFRMSGGSVTNCHTGIFVPALSRSNMTLTNKATIQNNQIGIHVQNGFRDNSAGAVSNFGMVMLDCARLLDNYLGIAGMNPLLLIDAYANSGTKDPALVRSNHFRLTTNGNFARRLFFVCYDGTQYTPASISATGNFWEGVVNGAPPAWRLFNATLNSPPPAGCFITNSLNNVALLRDPMVVAEPVVCPVPGEVPDPPGPGDFSCPPPPNSNISGVLHQQFFRGYKQFTADAEGSGDFSASDALFKPLSDISDGSTATMSAGCTNFVLGARAFTPGNPIPLQDDGEDRAAAQPGSAAYLLAMPNPASDQLTLYFPANGCTIRAFDLTGNLVHEVNSNEGTTNFNTTSWPVGIYIIEAIGIDFKEQVKVLIQR